MKMVLFIVIIVLVSCPVMAETVNETLPASIDLTAVIVAVLGLIFNLIVAWLGRSVIPKVNTWLEARTTEEQRTTLNGVIVTLVEAAEQLFKGSNRGQERLVWGKNQLNLRGVDVDIPAIEAAVKSMNDSVRNALTK